MTYLSVGELAEKCNGTNLIALAGRDEEENTAYAIKVCKCMQACDKIIYFSLRDDVDTFRKKNPELSVVIDDTAGLEIEELEGRIRETAEASPIGLVVIDYLQLLSNPMICKTRREEVESIVKRLKQLAEDFSLPILMILSLSKYALMDRPIIREFDQYGDIKSFIDIIVYVESINLQERTHQNRKLQQNHKTF